MKNIERVIKFTPIEQIFSEEELNQMMKVINPQPKQCYRNNWLFALMMKSKYPSIDYCEGMYRAFWVHAFNSLIVNGVRHYVDFSSYYLCKRYGIERYDTAIVLREYTVMEMKPFIDRYGFEGCIIDLDGTFDRYIDKLCRRYSKVAEFIKERDELKKKEVHAIGIC